MAPPEITVRISLPATLARGLIHLYRFLISPLFPPSCRFTPSCSNYALQAFETRPFLNATWLTLRRVLRCHPWSRGGHDPLI